MVVDGFDCQRVAIWIGVVIDHVAEVSDVIFACTKVVVDRCWRFVWLNLIADDLFDLNKVQGFTRWCAVRVDKDDFAVETIAIAVCHRLAGAIWASYNEAALTCQIERVVVVAASAAVDVIARTTKDDVSIVAAEDVVRPFATGQHVVAAVAFDDVVAVTTVDHVVAVQTFNRDREVDVCYGNRAGIIPLWAVVEDDPKVRNGAIDCHADILTVVGGTRAFFVGLGARHHVAVNRVNASVLELYVYEVA